MTTLRMSSSNTQAAEGFQALVGTVTRFIARQRAGYLAYQETMHELNKLSVRDLEDIGFAGSDLRDIARYAAAEAKAKL